jgi:hypothetical protein
MGSGDSWGLVVTSNPDCDVLLVSIRKLMIGEGSYVADGVCVGVQAKGEFTVTIRRKSWDGNLRVVDDLVSIGVSDEGRGELEWERSFPAIVFVLILLGLLVVLVSLLGVLILVPPCRSGGLVVGLLSGLTVVLGGRSGHGQGGENSE